MAVRTVSNAGGNWNATTTWVGGVVPSATLDTVAFTATSGQLTVNVASTCIGIDFTNYVNTITFTALLTVNGPVNLGTGGYTQAGASGIQVGATATHTSGGVTWSRVWTFAGTSQTHTLSGTWTFTGTLNFSPTTAMTLTGSTINTANLTVTTTATVSGTTAIVFNGTGTWSHTATGVIRNNVTINTVGTLTIGTNIYYNTGTLSYTAGTVNTTTNNSTLNISATTTINTGGMGTTTNAWNNVTLTVASTFIIALSSNFNITGLLTITSTNTAITLSFSGVGLFNPSGAMAVNLNSVSSATFAITIPNTFTVINLIFNCGTNQNGIISLNGNSINITGNLSQTNATFVVVLAGTTTLNLTGTGTWSTTSSGSGVRNSLTINTAGTITITGIIYYNTGVLTYTTGTVITTGSTLFVGLSTTLSTGTLPWNNVILSGVSTITLTSNLNVGGNLTTQTGAVTINGLFNVNVSGNLAINITTGGTSTIVLNGTGTWSHSSAVYLSNPLTINTSGTITVSGIVYCGTGTLTRTSGTVTTTSSTLTVLNTTTLNTGGVTWNNVTINVNTSTVITLPSNLNITGTLSFVSNGASLTLSFSGVGVLNPSGALNVTLNSSVGAAFTVTIPNILTVTNFAFNCGVNNSGTITLNGNSINITGNLSQTNGTFTVTLLGTTNLNLTGTGTWSVVTASTIGNNLTINTAGTITISGNVYYNTGTLTHTSGTVTTTGSTLNISAASTLNTNILNWNNIIISGGTQTLTSNLNIGGNLTTQTGTVTINGLFNVNVSGNLAINRTTNGTSTIVLNGNGTWSSTGFYLSNNLTFNTSGTITISGSVYYNTGTLTYTTGTVNVTGSTLFIGASPTISTPGLTWNNVTFATIGNYAFTITSDLLVGGTFTIGGGGTINGLFNIYCGVLAVNNSTSGAGSVPVVLSGVIYCSGNCTISGATGNISIACIVYVGGSLFFNAPATNYQGGTGFVMTGTGVLSQLSNSYPILGNITFNKSSNITITTDLYFYVSVAVNITNLGGKINATKSTLYINTVAGSGICNLIGMNTINWKAVQIVSGASLLMNEFFSGSPGVVTTITPSSTTNYTITFQDRFEKFSKFVKVSRATLSNPGQLTVTTNKGNQLNNIGIKFAPNQITNGLAKNTPSVQSTLNYGIQPSLLMTDPTLS